MQAAHSRHGPDMFLCHAGSRKGVPPPPVGRNALRIVAQSVARPAGDRVDAGSKPAGTPGASTSPMPIRFTIFPTGMGAMAARCAPLSQP